MKSGKNTHKPRVNPYDLSAIFHALKSKLKRELPKHVNPYDCGGSAQYGRFKTDE